MADAATGTLPTTRAHPGRPALGAFALAAWACSDPAPPRPAPARPPPAPAAKAGPVLRFAEVALPAGLDLVHDTGARGAFHVPESNSGGGGFWDPDGDGRPDVLLLSGAPVAGGGGGPGGGSPPSSVRHFANVGGGRFEDRTAAAGLGQGGDVQTFAAADVDGDGREDLVVGGSFVLRLLLQGADGVFTDATAAWGLAGWRGIANALAFVDGPEGRPDLVVGRYTDWTPEAGLRADCRRADGRPTYCAPQAFGAGPLAYYRNGGGAYVQDAAGAGLGGDRSKALGIVVLDHDGDGDRDLFVANDSAENLLFERDGAAFVEAAMLRGLVALDGMKAPSGMGVDAADLLHDGGLCLAVGNFAGQPATLHCQARPPGGAPTPAIYEELSGPSGVGAATTPWVTFGVRFADLDLDGRDELVVANGHVEQVEDLTGVPYAQPVQVLSLAGAEGGRPRFADLTPAGGLGGRPVVGRGLATADYDGDGDVDVLVIVAGGRPLLLRNDSVRRGRPLRLRLQGARPADRGLWSDVRLRVGGAWRRRAVVSGGSYGGESDRALVFGVADGEAAGPALVTWPSGRRERFDVPAGAAEAVLVEGQGVAAAPPQPSGGRAAGAPAVPAVPAAADPLLAARDRALDLDRRGDGAGADAAIAALLHGAPHPSRLLDAVAPYLLGRGSPRLAVQVLDAVLAATPGRLDARALRAEARLAAGDLPGARTDAREVLARSPTYGAALRVLSRAAEREGAGAR